MKEYDVIEHSADLKIIAHGKNLKELYKNALKGMFETIEPDIIFDDMIERRIEIKDENQDLSLIDFLSEALYQSDINNEAYFDVKFFKFEPREISAKLIGNVVKGFREEIKAVTYHGFELRETDNGFEAPIIFDI